jgi:hypothetical protein
MYTNKPYQQRKTLSWTTGFWGCLYFWVSLSDQRVFTNLCYHIQNPFHVHCKRFTIITTICPTALSLLLFQCNMLMSLRNAIVDAPLVLKCMTLAQNFNERKHQKQWNGERKQTVTCTVLPDFQFTRYNTDHFSGQTHHPLISPQMQNN